MNNIDVGVIIATYNRDQAIEKYALASLLRQTNNNFMVLVCDSSNNQKTKNICEKMIYTGINLIYIRNSRKGASSQRNEGIEFLNENYSELKAVLFIDDDCELSENVIDGIMDSFQSDNKVKGVNVPVTNIDCEDSRPKKSNFIAELYKILFLTSSIYGKGRKLSKYICNVKTCEDVPGDNIEWMSGGSMCIISECLFKDKYRFPEEFEFFGGYAVGEDARMSYNLLRDGKKMINSISGRILHYRVKGEERPPRSLVIASTLYNERLFFDAVHEKEHFLIRTIWLCLFKWATIGKQLKVFANCIANNEINQYFEGRKKYKQGYKNLLKSYKK